MVFCPVTLKVPLLVNTPLALIEPVEFNVMLLVLVKVAAVAAPLKVAEPLLVKTPLTVIVPGAFRVNVSLLVNVVAVLVLVRTEVPVLVKADAVIVPFKIAVAPPATVIVVPVMLPFTVVLALLPNAMVAIDPPAAEMEPFIVPPCRFMVWLPEAERMAPEAPVIVPVFVTVVPPPLKLMAKRLEEISPELVIVLVLNASIPYTLVDGVPLLVAVMVPLFVTDPTLEARTATPEPVLLPTTESEIVPELVKLRFCT